MESDSDPEAFPSSNKRQKTLTITQSPLSSSKGKEKIDDDIEADTEEDESVDSNSKVCGICFSEGGKAVRGWIDSCNHYFCFVCIMEWSKVESRCPLCKQRFKTIVRKPKDEVFNRERIINVPVRNQVWHPLGNQSELESELSDPYAEVNCTECQSSLDEHLLLLCDLCDSAAHTFCVGLGATVPEGDWYCHDCALSRNVHSDNEIDTDNQDSGNPISTPVAATNIPVSEIALESSTERTSYRNEHSNTETDYQDSRNSIRTPVTATHDAISEIVRESHPRNVNRSTRRTSSSHVPDRDIRSKITMTDSSARTLSHCRSVHNRIQVLRRNWDALRRGSLAFSTNLPNSGGKNDKKHNRKVIYDKSSKPQSSSYVTPEPKSTKDNGCGDGLNCKGPYDIDRAWKMLDIAKSVQRAREGTQSSHQASNYHPSKRDVPKEAKNTGSTVSTSKCKTFQPKDLGRVVPEKNYSYESVEVAKDKNISQMPGERRLTKDSLGISFCQRPPSTHTSQSCELPLVKKAHILEQVDLFRQNSYDENRISSNMIVRSANNWPVSQTESSSKTSDLFYIRPDLCPSSCSKEEISKKGGNDKSYAKIMVRKDSKKGGKDKSCAKIMVRKDEGAKCEVQSLVKLNLKLLSRDKLLGVNGFKEVARLATHSILAACGLEHKESSVRPLPGLICRHNDQTKQLHMSNLMPTSCRECFYAFVKDVVSSIMAEGRALLLSS